MKRERVNVFITENSDLNVFNQGESGVKFGMITCPLGRELSLAFFNIHFNCLVRGTHAEHRGHEHRLPYQHTVPQQESDW